MNQFVLAFPIPAAVADVFSITEVAQVAADAKTLMIPGCSVAFNVVRHEAQPGLSEIFKEHHEVSDEEAKAIDAHRSLLFLLGNIKSADELRMVNGAILKVLAAGRLYAAVGHRLDCGWFPRGTR